MTEHKAPPAIQSIQIKLSNTSGRLLLGCVETLDKRSSETDMITRGILGAIANELNKTLGLGGNRDNSEKSSAVFRLTPLAYEAVLKTVALAQEVDPESHDKEFRTTLLNTLRASNPVTRESVPVTRGTSSQPGNVGGESARQDGDGDAIPADLNESSVPRIGNLNPNG